MTAIWKDDGDSWTLLAPSGFPHEATLHGLVDRAPHILPLSGSPQLAIVGREVAIGGNRADLVAVEQSRRLAIIEIKLAQNAESRRAVIAQVLTYAALLRGTERETLEQQVLGSHLQQRGYASLLHAAQDVDQVGGLDAEQFHSGLQESLQAGRFRLILVLDEAPPELVKLVGFLEAVTDKLVIDLITVASYEIDGSQVVVPRRVDPEREPATVTDPAKMTSTSADTGTFFPGKQEFLASIEVSPADQQPELRRLANWAASLESAGLAKLRSYRGKSGRITLLPYIPGEDAGLVTIWNDKGAYLSFWRSVFERCAPVSLQHFEQSSEFPKIGQGNTTKEINEELLSALTGAYREAVAGRIAPAEEQKPS